MTLASGTRLGPHEIVAPLDAGGMGEVYRARDTRLARDVAVKVLDFGLAKGIGTEPGSAGETRSATGTQPGTVMGTAVYETGGWISDPSVAPDGRSVAFLDHPILGDDRGYASVIDAGGKARRLTRELESTQGLAWSRDLREVWFTGAERGSGRALLAVDLSGAMRTLDRAPGTLTLCGIGSDGDVLVRHGIDRRGIIGLAPGESKEHDLSWLDWSIVNSLSDDGRTLLFTEQGDGGGPGYAVYLRRTDGSPAVRLGGGDGQALSPDGSLVLALRLDPAPAQIVLLPTGAGEARPVTSDEITHLTAAFMPDGRGMIFTGFQPDRPARSYVQDLAGGPPRPVTQEGISGLLVSPDGAMLVAGRRFYPLDGGEPRTIAGLYPKDGILRWSDDSRSLLIRHTLDGGAVEALRLDLETGKRIPIGQIFTPPSVTGTGISTPLLTPDAGSYVYGYTTRMSDLYLVRGLR